MTSNYPCRGSAVGLLLAVVISISGCFGDDETKWTEEVKLSDGRIIQVQRIARRHASGFPNAPRGADISNGLSYKPLGIFWRANAPANLMSFDIVAGVAYLAVYHAPHGFCQRKAAGQFKARFYRWEKGSWTEVEQSKYPTDVALVNLYRGYWGHDTSLDAQGMVTWRQKSVRDGFDPDNPETIGVWYERYHRVC